LSAVLRKGIQGLSARIGVGVLIRYLLLTGLSIFLVFSVTFVSHELLGLSENVAVAIALFVAFVVNFSTAKFIVFRSSGCWKKQALKFLVVSVSFRASEYLGFYILFNVFQIHYILALGIVLMLSLVFKFITYKYWVFNETTIEGVE
jgi:putative flippase GtrA